jgi:hypothetical protein
LVSTRNTPQKQWHPKLIGKIRKSYDWHVELQSKQAGRAILILEKKDFKQISVRRDKEVYIWIKGKIQQENKMILNSYALNVGSPKFIKHFWAWRKR